MSKNISLNEIKEFWPEKAPDVNIVQKYVKKYVKLMMLIIFHQQNELIFPTSYF